MQLLDELFAIIEKKKVSILKFSKETGISSDRLYQWKANRGKPKVEDYEKIQNWIIKNTEQEVSPAQTPETTEDTKPPPDQSDLQKLIDATLLTAKASVINAEALRSFADAQKHDAITRERLTGMLKEGRQAIADAPEQNLQDVHAMLFGLRELLIDVATGKIYKSAAEARSFLNKATASAAQKTNEKDIQNSLGR